LERGVNLRALITGRLTRLAAKRPARRATAVGSARRAAMVAVFVGAAAYALFHLGLSLAANRVPLVFDPFYADKETRLTAVEHASPGAPVVLVLGSSRALNGIAADRIGPGTTAGGAPAVAYNFGVPAAGSITNLVYLRRLLADGHAPSVLVLEVMPPLFADDPRWPPEAGLLLADRLTWAEIDLVTTRYGFPRETVRARRTRADYHPWECHRFKIMSRLDPEALPGESRLHSGRASDAHGWLPSFAPAPVPKAFELAAANYGDWLRDWKPGPAPALALRDTLALARKHGITVALLLMPESGAFRALCPEPARGRLNAFLAGVCAEFNCPLIDAREWVSDDSFVDGHHLLRPAALAFTDRLTTEAILPLLRKRGAP
jgi:hypothetical protein